MLEDFVLRVPGDEKHGKRQLLRRELLHELTPGHAGHDHIGHEQIYAGPAGSELWACTSWASSSRCRVMSSANISQ